MFFVYLGYLALRRVIDDPSTRARRAAIYGIFSVVQIPIVHFSVVWWRDIHQLGTVANPTGIQMDGILLVAFFMGLGAFALVATALVRRRYLLAALENAVAVALQSGAGSVAGDAVVTPRLGDPIEGEVRR
jgi:heme exporter protein C